MHACSCRKLANVYDKGILKECHTMLPNFSEKLIIYSISAKIKFLSCWWTLIICMYLMLSMKTSSTDREVWSTFFVETLFGWCQKVQLWLLHARLPEAFKLWQCRFMKVNNWDNKLDRARLKNSASLLNYWKAKICSESHSIKNVT